MLWPVLFLKIGASLLDDSCRSTSLDGPDRSTGLSYRYERSSPTLSNQTETPKLIDKIVQDGGKGILNAKGFYENAPEEAEMWCKTFEFSFGRYAGGTGMTEGFISIGRELLKEMEGLNMILNVTHLTDKGFTEATDLYHGP